MKNTQLYLAVAMFVLAFSFLGLTIYQAKDYFTNKFRCEDIKEQMNKDIIVYSDNPQTDLTNYIKISTEQYTMIRDESIKYNCDVGEITSPNIIIRKRIN